MPKITHGPKLLREIMRFAMANKAYWLVPCILALAIAAALVVVFQGAAPLIYTLY